MEMKVRLTVAKCLLTRGDLHLDSVHFQKIIYLFVSHYVCTRYLYCIDCTLLLGTHYKR